MASSTFEGSRGRVSWECTAYVSSRRRCPDGAEISAAQKLLLFVLSNYHNPNECSAWPGIPTLAEEALSSIGTVKRHLDYLEEHFLIERRERVKKGRGAHNKYVFLELDDPKRLAQKLREQRNAQKETVQNEPFFWPDENGPQEGQKQPINGPETVQNEERNGPETVQINGAIRTDPDPTEPEPDPDPDQHAVRAALKTWITIKTQLQAMLDDREWKLWVRPALLLKVMSGSVLLVALPPNGRIIEAARARLPALRESALAHGYNVNLTRYPDDWEREQVRERYPEFYEQMLGSGAVA